LSLFPIIFLVLGLLSRSKLKKVKKLVVLDPAVDLENIFFLNYDKNLKGEIGFANKLVFPPYLLEEVPKEVSILGAGLEKD